jgi:hypothetical protein
MLSNAWLCALRECLCAATHNQPILNSFTMQAQVDSRQQTQPRPKHKKRYPPASEFRPDDDDMSGHSSEDDPTYQPEEDSEGGAAADAEVP